MTATPELRSTNAGTHVTQNSIAVTRQYKDASGNKQTDFITFVCWGKQADFVCNYIKKGTLIGIEGELRTRVYLDKQNMKRYTNEVHVHNIEFLESRSVVESRQANQLTQEAPQVEAPIPVHEEDVPPQGAFTNSSQQGSQEDLNNLNARLDGGGYDPFS
jgi:single-strand DNA-binding protein